jgi:hypothetical protein
LTLDNSIGGDVILYKDVDVVGNGYLRERYADVWVECGAGFRYNVDNHDPARWWCLAGRVEGNVNVGGGYNGKRVCGRQDGYMGNVDICGTYFFE